eukprot:13647834-Alexandrium_andersonii.AAC.1
MPCAPTAGLTTYAPQPPPQPRVWAGQVGREAAKRSARRTLRHRSSRARTYSFPSLARHNIEQSCGGMG